MKKILFILILFISTYSYGTKQIPDILIWNNDTLSLYSDPLGKYPKFNNLNLFGNQQAGNSTACWKGYWAEWKIIDNQLYLSNIYSCDFSNDKIKSDLKKLFPKEYENGLVFANWYKGKLFIPKSGNIRKKIEIYKSEWVLTVKNGKVKKKEFFENSNFYISVYSQNMDSLRNFIENNINWNNIPTIKDEKEKVYAFIKTGKTKNDFSIKVKSRNEKLSEETKRVLKLLPEFDFYYQRGAVFRLSYATPIIFDESKRPK